MWNGMQHGGSVLKYIFLLSLLCVAMSDTIVLRAPKQHEGTIIFLHGLGDTGYGWSDALHQLQRKFPNFKVVLPTAPKQPVTINGGMTMTSWHDIISLEHIHEETFTGIEKSIQIVRDFLNREIESGVPSEKIVLGGFSQGAALSLLVGFRFEKKLGAILAFSGYLPFYADFSKTLSPQNKDTKVFMSHGNFDRVVGPSIATASVEVIKKAGVNLDFKLYNIAHQQPPMTDVIEFLRQIFPN